MFFYEAGLAADYPKSTSAGLALSHINAIHRSRRFPGNTTRGSMPPSQTVLYGWFHGGSLTCFPSKTREFIMMRCFG
ncbi:hypothetical protein RRG08_056833 [Elysia crispata]|uniref:Uncharacterized protein n=1 Tax=Elysia crispata TaxID=231223 RepID=A0AAE1AC49_9GAST|nr:hypothetical protein RRG08_056833 [Elysia crispata]